jgi:uncharacterized phiE125 gp8 family phage protein
MPISLAHHYPTLKTTVEPAVEPVTLAEASAYADYEGNETSKNELISSLIVAARRKVERDAGLALITQTRQAKFDCFPCGYQRFPVAPIQSVAITYLDGDGASQTWGTSNYQLDDHNMPPRVAPVNGVVWPTTKTGTFEAATFTLVCGYGADVADVPEEAKTAIKLLVRDWFWGRCASGEVLDLNANGYWALISNISWRPVNV